MQYILTQQEYDELRTKREVQYKIDTDKLQALCTQIANEMPVAVSWRKESPPEPWGCIMTHEHHYCDECPVRKICPNPRKDWSK